MFKAFGSEFNSMYLDGIKHQFQVVLYCHTEPPVFIFYNVCLRGIMQYIWVELYGGIQEQSYS